MRQAPAGARNGRRAISAAPAGARIQSSRRTRRGGLISNVPSGQVVAFPALILDMQCVLGGPRPPLQKTSLPSSPCEHRYPASKIADVYQQVRSEISEGNPGGCQNKHDAEKKQIHQVNNYQRKEGAVVGKVSLFLRDHPAGKREVKCPGRADQAVEKP